MEGIFAIAFRATVDGAGVTISEIGFVEAMKTLVVRCDDLYGQLIVDAASMAARFDYYRRDAQWWNRAVSSPACSSTLASMIENQAKLAATHDALLEMIGALRPASQKAFVKTLRVEAMNRAPASMSEPMKEVTT